jgi:hypothetical protein
MADDATARVTWRELLILAGVDVDRSPQGDPLETATPAEIATLDAFVARLFPADGQGPGAHRP